jgi:hypothetical protein
LLKKKNFLVPQDDYAHLEDKIILELVKVFLSDISSYKRPTRIIIQRKVLEKTSTLKLKRMLIKSHLEISSQNQTSKNSKTVQFAQV